MGRLDSLLNQSAKELEELSINLKKGARIAEYWNPSDSTAREKAKREIEKIHKKENHMIVTFCVLWVLMIIMTVIICVYFV